MRKARWAVLLTIVAAAPCNAQTPADGEIAGRIVDASAAILPGVRVVISGDNGQREAITDKEGEFAVRGLKLGTYRVSIELPGFTSEAGSVTLSPTVRRAHIAWPLSVGCLEEDVRVIPSARDAARAADTIAHVRVQSDDGQVHISTRPECPGSLSQVYTIEIVNAAVRRARHTDGRSTIRIARHPGEARLQAGSEHLAILWPAPIEAGGLLFPIVSGRVSAPSEDPLHGMRIEEALKTLSNWSGERPR
jgi:hypothetical protein